MFKRKWFWVLAVFVALIIAGIGFFNPKPPPPPMRVYKAVIPDSKPSLTKPNMGETDVATPHNYDHSHDHSYETTPHSDAAEGGISGGEYTWQEGYVFEGSSSKVDPWEQTYPEQEITDPDDTYPPRDWYKTEDPELRAEYLYAQLIKQFGDTPEVQAIGEYELKAAQGIPPTLEEYTAYLEAHYYLFPNKQNQQTLNNLRKAIASGHKIIFE